MKRYRKDPTFANGLKPLHAGKLSSIQIEVYTFVSVNKRIIFGQISPPQNSRGRTRKRQLTSTVVV